MSASTSAVDGIGNESHVHGANSRAATRALGTREILCLILVQVDQRALLFNAQRVCKAWRLQIQTAPLLRRRLFLHKRPSSEGAHENKVTPRTLNPVLAELFPPWFDREAEDIDPSEFELARQVRDHLIASRIHGDFIGDLPPNLGGGSSGAPRRRFGESGLWEQLRNTELYSRRCQSPENPFLRDGATWMQMHVSDPPVTKLAMYRSCAGMYWEHNRAFRIDFPEGLRMGEFYRLVLASTRDVWYGYRLEVQWPPAGADKITQRHIETACAQLGIAANKSPEKNAFDQTGAMGAEVLVIITRSTGCMAGIPRHTEQETQRQSGYDFFAERFADEIHRIESLPWVHKPVRGNGPHGVQTDTW